MTEAEWRTSRDPRAMLRAMLDAVPNPDDLDRLVRLFSAACCRTVWEDIADDDRAAVENAERFGRGCMTVDGFRITADAWHLATRWSADWVARLVWETMARPQRFGSAGRIDVAEWYQQSDRYSISRRVEDTCQSLRCLCGSRRAGPAPPGSSAPSHPWHATFQAAVAEIDAVMSDLLRCVVGNPFRRSELDPTWLSSTVVGLVQTIANASAFDRLPILADALEEAGCDDEQVLTHCRAEAAHARGCWVVEMLLRPS